MDTYTMLAMGIVFVAGFMVLLALNTYMEERRSFAKPEEGSGGKTYRRKVGRLQAIYVRIEDSKSWSLLSNQTGLVLEGVALENEHAEVMLSVFREKSYCFWRVQNSQGEKVEISFGYDRESGRYYLWTNLSLDPNYRFDFHLDQEDVRWLCKVMRQVIRRLS